MGFEDDQFSEATPVDAVQAANEYAQKQRQEQESRRAETLIQMEQNKIDEEKAKAKIQLIANIVQKMNEPIIADLKEQRTQIEEIKTAIGQISQVFQTMGQQQAPNPALASGVNMNELPQELKMQMASGLLDGIAKLVMAWRSNSAPQAANQTFNWQELASQTMYDMFRASTDRLMQDVYQMPIRPPPRLVNPQPAAPQPEHKLD